jgi:chemotaxis regulatin CheY-phosphate phosphatase CheZ
MDKKPEVNLEVSSGFFRITAEEAVYNITVLSGPTAKLAHVVPEVVRVEKKATMEVEHSAGQGDDYYRQVSNDLYRDIGQLAKSLSSTMMHIPMEDRRVKRVELDEAGEKIEDAKNQLKDIVDMTESATMEIMDCVEHIQGNSSDVQGLLTFLKDHKAFRASAGETEDGTSGDIDTSAAEIGEQLARAREIVDRLQQNQPPAAVADPAGGMSEIASRYLFSFDVIFQTLYEFCTNETVKGHLTDVREQADTLLNREELLDSLNRLAASLEPDGDNFLLFPLADLLEALAQACTDSKIKNLFKRMSTNRDTLFLDQSLPLEVPPLEEPSPESREPGENVESGTTEEPESELHELGRLLDASMAALSDLPARTGASAPGMSRMSIADQAEIYSKIEDAFRMANNITGDVQKITEALSFQDLSGQQIMKIIKLLSDFQVQLLALVVSFGSQLKLKERDATITPEESKRFAQEEVDSYINKIGGSDEEGGAGILDQDSVNQILADMGF